MFCWQNRILIIARVYLPLKCRSIKKHKISSRTHRCSLIGSRISPNPELFYFNGVVSWVTSRVRLNTWWMKRQRENKSETKADRKLVVFRNTRYQIEVYNMAVSSVYLQLKRLKKGKPMCNEIVNGVVKFYPKFFSDSVVFCKETWSLPVTNANYCNVRFYLVHTIKIYFMAYSVYLINLIALCVVLF